MTWSSKVGKIAELGLSAWATACKGDFAHADVPARLPTLRNRLGET